MEYVEEARRIADVLVRGEMSGPGDMPRAMVRLERRHGLPVGTLKGLRYRPRKSLTVELWAKLVAALEAESVRQRRLWDHEIALARAAGEELDRLDQVWVRAASFVAGDAESEADEYEDGQA